LIAFLSGVTNRRYTATQYALFSSIYALPGKTLEGFSGFVVDAIGYTGFFFYASCLGLPALILLYWLSKQPDVPEALAPVTELQANR
jgi:PAT family beta-lactamase induction signal transducer AmpG